MRRAQAKFSLAISILTGRCNAGEQIPVPRVRTINTRTMVVRSTAAD
jgi:hypothetical protein